MISRPVQAGGFEAEVSKIEALIQKYEKSISDADTTLAAEVWAQNEEVTFIHPQGQAYGWEQIKGDVYEKLMRDLFSERRLIANNISIHVYKDAAWAEFSWIFVAKLRSNGSPVKTQGWETQVYHKGDKGWRLVHVHYSGVPAGTGGL
jgi:ketosteroid isomerase-like protein